ncbi:MAG: adenosylcobinamide-GDP ribazoletransferase [Victivallaceae bacterium]|nr:adenosylcobinamide-GDP ribazoletransferase [Victivallaceae bacterium]
MICFAKICRMVRLFPVALSVLSVLPCGKNFQPDEMELSRSVNAFPLVGILLGGIVALAGMLLQTGLPILPLAVALVLIAEALSKGFHLDGAGDTFDGLLSGRTRERKLEIMRDSRIGSMGVLAIFSVLALKISLLASLPAHRIAFAAGSMVLAGRCGLIWPIAFGQYARREGLGALWFRQKPFVGMLLAAVLPASVLQWDRTPDGCWIAGALPVVLILGGWLWSLQMKKVLGGHTGDTLGAFEEFSEIAALLLIVTIGR